MVVVAIIGTALPWGLASGAGPTGIVPGAEDRDERGHRDVSEIFHSQTIKSKVKGIKENVREVGRI